MPVIADPPVAILPGAPFEMVGAPVSDEPGWSSGVIEPAPIPFGPVEPTLPRFEAMLPVTSVLNKGYPEIVAGGGIQQLPIAKAAPPLLALEANEKLVEAQLKWDASPMVPSVPEPNFADRYVPAETAKIPEPTLPRAELAGNPFRDLGTCEITHPRSRADLGWAYANREFYYTGTTKTGAGVALANCLVTLTATGRFTKAFYSFGPDIVGQQVSDGSGNFSLQATNADHMLIAYKDGSPDVAGLTKNDIAPTSGLSIYLRDPTAADSPSSAAYRVIGSPVVRRVGR